MSDLVEKWRWLKKNNLDSWQDFQLRDIQMLVDRIEELEKQNNSALSSLEDAARGIEKDAMAMPAPNPHTPKLIMWAIQMRNEAIRQRVETSDRSQKNDLPSSKMPPLF